MKDFLAFKSPPNIFEHSVKINAVTANRYHNYLHRNLDSIGDRRGNNLHLMYLLIF